MSTDFYDFGTGPDDVVEPSPEDPRIQWFHRRNFVDFDGKAKGITVGWHSQQGLREDWDIACATVGLRTIHLKQGGKIVPYWQIGSNAENEDEWGSASPFILAKGVPSEWDMQDRVVHLIRQPRPEPEKAVDESLPEQPPAATQATTGPAAGL